MEDWALTVYSNEVGINLSPSSLVLKNNLQTFDKLQENDALCCASFACTLGRG